MTCDECEKYYCVLCGKRIWWFFQNVCGYGDGFIHEKCYHKIPGHKPLRGSCYP